jgi:hypothetical protein
MNNLNTAVNNNHPIHALSNDMMMELAPSIFAEHAHPKASDRYSFVPTIKAIDYLRKDGWEPIWCDEVQAKADNMIGYQNHVVRFSKQDLVLKDERLDLVMFNSHNTGSAYRLLGGVFRFICANQLTSGDEISSSRHRHVGFDGKAFIESAKMVCGDLEKTAEVIEDWKSIELTRDERGVYGKAALQVAYGSEAPVSPGRILAPARVADGEPNLWNTFNTVQENLIKGGQRGRSTSGRRLTTRPVKSINRDAKLNQALWTLAEEMAHIKTTNTAY